MSEKIEINLNTAFRVTRAVLPGVMRRRYGRIVHIASVTGPLVSNPHSAGYSAAKAAMVGMTRALAMEVADKGITVNAVAPGWIAYGLFDPAGDHRRQELAHGAAGNRR